MKRSQFMIILSFVLVCAPLSAYQIDPHAWGPMGSKSGGEKAAEALAFKIFGEKVARELDHKVSAACGRLPTSYGAARDCIGKVNGAEEKDREEFARDLREIAEKNMAKFRLPCSFVSGKNIVYSLCAAVMCNGCKDFPIKKQKSCGGWRESHCRGFRVH